MADNYRVERTRKRGRSPSKLVVRPFLLDPDENVKKTTKKIGSSKAISELQQKRYGPPSNEYGEKVEFSFELTNEMFKQKLAEIYPRLKNSCFVFMIAGKDNVLKVLNPGRCCYRCYTPENVHNSERGQGRLYIRIIPENEISRCNHAVKILRRTFDGNQQRFVPILPKPVATVVPASNDVATTTVALATNNQAITSPGVQTFGNSIAQNHLPTSTAILQSASTPTLHGGLGSNSLAPSGQRFLSSVDMIPARNQVAVSATVSRLPSTPQVNNYFNVQSQRLLATLVANSLVSLSDNPLPEGQFATSSNVSHTASAVPVNGSFNNASQEPTTPGNGSYGVFSQEQSLPLSVLLPPSQPYSSSGNMASQTPPITSSTVSQSLSRPVLPFVSGYIAPENHQILRSAEIPDERSAQSLFNLNPILQSVSQLGQASTGPFEQELETVETGIQGANEAIHELHGATVLPSAVVPPVSNSWVAQYPGLDLLAASVEAQGGWYEETIPGGQNIQTALGGQRETLPIDDFFQNVESTGKLEISSDVLNNDALLKKLNESIITIHTVVIQSTCEVQKVLKKFSLPSCLKVLDINGNILNSVDVSELVRCLNIVANLQELHICRTKFNESTFLGLSCALSICKNLKSLILTDNSLTGQEINALINAVEMMKNLKILNLSKCNLTETQAKAILHKHEQAENIVSLDLSHNTLQGNEIVIATCQLHSLEELDLSHNYVRFSPLPNWEGKRNHFSTRMKEISLFSNHMKPDDISNFCSLVKSELLKINLGFNHVGGSIWSLCSLGERIEHLKVLSLGSTDICDNVDGLVFLLSLVRELEDLNLSSNNLSPDHFQQLQKPLSKLNQLKTLNLSANYIGPDGMKAIADIFKEFPLLERLDMSSSYIREAEVSVLCKSLVSSRKLKYLDLSGNHIDIEVMDDVLVLPPTLEELLFSDITNGQKLFAQIRCLENLRKLHLNKLISRECDINALAEMLHYLVNLEELSLAGLDDPGYETVLLEIKWLGNLKKIDLSGITLIDVEEVELVQMLSSLSSLEELILTDMSDISRKGSEKVFIAIKLLKRLRKLSFGCTIISNGMQDFLDMLSSLPILEVVVFPLFDLGNSDFDPFKSLRCLRILDLCNTEIDDSNGEALARVLPSLNLLEKLALRFVYYKYESPLFAAFGKLKYLKALSLDIWGGKIDIDALVEVLASLHLLEKFELFFPGRGELHEKLQCDALGNLRYLKELSVMSYSGNVDIEALARALSSLQLLEKLELGCENFPSNEFDEQLYAAIGKLKHLRRLSLLEFKVTNGEGLAKVLPLLELLEELVLCWQHDGVFNSEHENQVIAAIGKLRYLKELDLQCYDHDINMETLSKTLPSLRLLEKLKLAMEGLNDKLERRESKELFIALRQLKRLKELHLKICKPITRTDAEGLARAFMTCEMLEKVKLDARSCLNESQCKRLLIAVANLKNLKALSLELGKITRDNVDVLVEVLTSLQVLEKLTLFVHSCSIHDCGEDCDEDCDEGCDSNSDGECGHDTYNNSCSKCRHEKNERLLIKTKVLTAVKKLKHFKKFELDKSADLS